MNLVWHIVIACSRHYGAFCWCNTRCGEETEQAAYQISTSKHTHVSVWLYTEFMLLNKQVLTRCSTCLLRGTTAVIAIRAGIWWWPPGEIKTRRQWQILQKEHEWVNCHKTILQILKEKMVIKKDKEPWRNKHTCNSYCFHIQMPKDTLCKKMGLSQKAKACFAY